MPSKSMNARSKDYTQRASRRPNERRHSGLCEQTEVSIYADDEDLVILSLAGVAHVFLGVPHHDTEKAIQSPFKDLQKTSKSLSKAF